MKIKTIIATGAVSLALIACVTNPITGRKSVQIVGNDQLSAMGVQEYQTALSKAKVITNTTDATRVKNVGIRIKNAATNYYKSIGREADLRGYRDWETDRKSTRLNSSHRSLSRMPSSA